MARGLVGSGTKLIGVVLTDISNSFFADLEKYMEQAARKKGYSLILFNSDYDREKEKHCLVCRITPSADANKCLAINRIQPL